MGVVTLTMNFVLYFLLPVFALLYFWLKKKYSFWEERGFIGPKPVFLKGNFDDVGTKVHYAHRFQNIYNEFKGKTPLVGMFTPPASPVLLITDPEILKLCFIKEFSSFHNRGGFYNEEVDPCSAHLFNLEDEKWKYIRNKVSPTFSSGKMKMMYPTIASVGDRFVAKLDDFAKNNETFEAKDLSMRFTCDVIGSCAFGIELNSLGGESEVFTASSRVLEAFNLTNPLAMLKNVFPKTARFLGCRLFPKDATDFFLNLLTTTTTYREKNNVERYDLLNLLMQLKNQGFIEGEKSENDPTKFTFNELAAQAFVFFFAGFETSGMTMNYALYELGRNQEVQDKARKEINDKIAEHKGLTYDALMDMGYLEQIFNESLRIYPPAIGVGRLSNAEVKVPGTKLVIPKGVTVVASAHAFHHDPEYFPDPETFNPDHFSKENEAKRPSNVFLPFGLGPRACIGNRFAHLQSRFALATLLKNFKVTVNSKTENPLTFIKTYPLLQAQNGIWLNVERV